MAAKQQEYLALIPLVTTGCILKRVKQEKTEPWEMSQGHIKTASSRSSSSFYNAKAHGSELVCYLLTQTISYN